MTKAIEAPLRRSILKEDVLGTQIANTYFYQKTRPKSRRKKTLASIKKLSGICAAVAAAAVLVITFAAASSFMYARYLDFLKEKFAGANMVKVIENGAVDREFIKNFGFRGYAKNNFSKIFKDFLVLNNAKKYNWAALAIDFRFPVDLTGRKLHLVLRGNIGGEKVHIIMRDTKNKSVRLADTYLSSRWNDKTISLADVKGYVNLKSINHIRIESGYVGESNKIDWPISLKIYVKDLTITKET